MRNIELKLKEKMNGYYYGQMNLLKGNFNFVFHYGDFFSIKDFYLGQGKVGVCNNQSEFYKRTNKGLNLIRVGGSEPTYFNSDGSNHFYLLFPTKPLPKEFWSFMDEERVKYLRDSDSLVVDPSFKKVLPLNSSGYHLDSSYKYPFSSDLWVTSDSSNVLPLGIMEEGELVSLSTHKSKMSFFFKRKFDSHNYLALPLGSKDLSLKLKGERFLKPLAKILNEKYLEYLRFGN